MEEFSRNKIRIGIHQPGYHRYLGYFYKMYKSDLFISYDTVQYVTREWQNRQRFYYKGKFKWLSVPVNKGRELIKDKIIVNPKILIDHWNFIKEIYRRTPYFDKHSKDLEYIYLKNEWNYLNDICDALTMLARDILGIKTKIIRDSESGIFPIGLKKADMLISSVQRAVQVENYDEVIYLPRNYPIPEDSYLNKKFNGSELNELEKFTASNLKVETYKFVHPIYKQHQNKDQHKFIPNLSVFDLIFNMGPKSLETLLSGGGGKYIREVG